MSTIDIDTSFYNVNFIHDNKSLYKKSKNKEMFVQQVFDHISETTELTIEEVVKILEQ
jgi:Tat protein secretion system quality control protein TatD with DNase activity